MPHEGACRSTQAQQSASGLAMLRIAPQLRLQLCWLALGSGCTAFARSSPGRLMERALQLCTLLHCSGHQTQRVHSFARSCTGRRMEGHRDFRDHSPAGRHLACPRSWSPAAGGGSCMHMQALACKCCWLACEVCWRPCEGCRPGTACEDCRLSAPSLKAPEAVRLRLDWSTEAASDACRCRLTHDCTLLPEPCRPVLHSQATSSSRQHSPAWEDTDLSASQRQSKDLPPAQVATHACIPNTSFRRTSSKEFNVLIACLPLVQ